MNWAWQPLLAGAAQIQSAAPSNDIAGTATVTFSGSGALAGFGPISGTATVDFSGAGTLAGTGDCAGTATCAFTASGTLADAGEDNIAGITTMAFTLSGTIPQPIPPDVFSPDPIVFPKRRTREEREEREAAIKQAMRPKEVAPTPKVVPEVTPEPPALTISPAAEAFQADIINLQARIDALRETRRNEAKREQLRQQLEMARQALYDEEAAILLLLYA